MENKYTSLKFKAKVKPVEKLNEEFTKCRVYVQGIGKNRNYSYMSKENVIKNKKKKLWLKISLIAFLRKS